MSRDLSKLSDLEFAVTQNKATEPPGTGKYYLEKREGIYHCKVCDAELFDSKAKYHSGSGWPSFFQAVKDGTIKYLEDNSLGMSRVEILCANCESHLGHVFDDGPKPSGKRYCVNSVSLILDKDKV